MTVPEQPNEKTNVEHHLEHILAQYLQRIDCGEQIDRRVFAKEHPDLADALESYFETAEQIERMAGPVVGDQPQQPVLMAPESPVSDASRDTILPEETFESTSESNGRDGRVLQAFGRYQIIRLLGQGAMGSVYLAHDTQLDREVALKIPKITGNDVPELLKRFLREAQSAATLRHPSICTVYDVGEIDGTYYISMAYIEGRQLSDYVASGRPFSLRQIALLVRKLALALQEAHDRGVVHRDLKPSNIMIDTKHEPIIMDFGLAS